MIGIKLPAPKVSAYERHPASAGGGVTYLAKGKYVAGWPADRLRLTSEGDVEVDVQPHHGHAGLADGQPLPVAPALAFHVEHPHHAGEITWRWHTRAYRLSWHVAIAYLVAATDGRYPMDRGGLLWIPHGALHGRHPATVIPEW